MKPIIIPLSMSSVFLLPYKGGYLQVDTGYEHDYSTYRKNLSKAGIALEDIHYLVLTHHHDDHAGFLNELIRDATITVIAHEQAEALLKCGENDKSRGGGRHGDGSNTRCQHHIESDEDDDQQKQRFHHV